MGRDRDISRSPLHRRRYSLSPSPVRFDPHSRRDRTRSPYSQSRRQQIGMNSTIVVALPVLNLEIISIFTLYYYMHWLPTRIWIMGAKNIFMCGAAYNLWTEGKLEQTSQTSETMRDLLGEKLLVVIKGVRKNFARR